MTTNMTAQQCKQELENILMDAVENGNFNYKVELNYCMYFKMTGAEIKKMFNK